MQNILVHMVEKNTVLAVKLLLRAWPVLVHGGGHELHRLRLAGNRAQ